MRAAHARADMEQVGINIDESLLEEIEDLRRERDREGESGTVSRSEVMREAMALGMVAAKHFDDVDGPEGVRDRRAWLRQILLDHEE